MVTEVVLLEKFLASWKRGGQEDRPEWLIYENVKGMLSSNRGLDYLAILAEMDKLGYDVEWQNINSKWFVPQNRERIYTIGHLRTKGRKQILPISRTDEANRIQLAEINNKNNDKQIMIPIDKAKKHPREIKIANCITAREDAGLKNRPAEGTAVIYPMSAETKIIKVGHRNGFECNLATYDPAGLYPTLDTSGGGGREPHIIEKQNQEIKVHPILTPFKEKKRQNGRRTKEADEPMFTLTAQDRHGVLIENHSEDKLSLNNIDTIYSEKYQCDIAIRKLTPKECFRLQGYPDKYFELAEAVNSNSQLYKQAGNGVTVNVTYAIGEKIAETE